MRLTSSYVIWAIANPPGLSCSIGLGRFLQGMRNAGKFDALDARNGYSLLEKLRLNAAPQLPRYFVLPRRQRSYLQPNRGSGSIEILDAKDSGAIHQRLRPCRITSQGSRDNLQRP